MFNIGFQPRVNVGSNAIYDQLRSLHGISDHQRSEVSEILKEADKDLDDYDTGIHLLENNLAFLR